MRRVSILAEHFSLLGAAFLSYGGKVEMAVFYMVMAVYFRVSRTEPRA